MHLVVDMEAFKDSEQFNDGYSPNERMVNIVTHESKHTIQLYFDPGPEYKKENNGVFIELNNEEYKSLYKELSKEMGSAISQKEVEESRFYQNYMNQRNEIEAYESGDKATEQYKENKKWKNY